MTQAIDVIVVFDKTVSIPKPLRFKIYDCGQWKSVDVDRIYNTDWVRKGGKVQIVYSCGSKSRNGQIIYYKLMYRRNKRGADQHIYPESKEESPEVSE